MVPLRAGIVRDIRNNVYRKIISLPLSFFSDERKGDIIARMSGDVGEIENSITGSLEMLIKNPILIIWSIDLHQLATHPLCHIGDATADMGYECHRPKTQK